MGGDDDIFSRWSHRKRAAEAPSPPQKAPPDPPSAPGPDPAELVANRATAEAVDLESLGQGSDISVFLREGVPELLRRKALGRLWRSDPVFANLDELVDYGEDYGRPELVMTAFKSAWQAGRGYLKEEPPEEAPPAPESEPEAEAEAETASQPEAPAPVAEEPPEPEPAPDQIADAAPDPAPPAPPSRRSLRQRLAAGPDAS